MNKKGQGLSMSTIIIAAIALLVLVILASFLLRSGGEVEAGTSCEEGMSGICEPEETNCDSGYIRHAPKDNTCADGEICCIPLG